MNKQELEKKAADLRRQLFEIEQQIRALNYADLEQMKLMRDDWLNKQNPVDWVQWNTPLFMVPAGSPFAITGLHRKDQT